MLEAIAAAGMGSISFDPGKLSVVWLAEDHPLDAVVTMGNIKQGSFRVDHTTSASADELEVSWFDRDAGWANRSLRILAPGVTVPRETARYAPLGVTTEAAAVRVARLTMAQNIYQRKSVSWEMDLEHLAFRRYSLIALAHDVTRWGYSGRVLAAQIAGDIVTLQLDDEVPFNDGAALRSIGLRIPGEQGYRVFEIEAFTGESRVIVLADPWPAGVPVPGHSTGNPAHDTLWIYDLAAAPGRRLRVTEIEPSPDLKGAKVTAVPEPDEFWSYMASGSYTAPAAPAAGPALAASNIVVTQRRLDVNYAEGTELSIVFDAVGPFATAQVWGAPDGETLQLLGTTLVTRFGPWPVGRDGDYAIEVRPFDALGRPGAFASTTHTVTLGEAVDGVRGRNLLDASNWVIGSSGSQTGGGAAATVWNALATSAGGSNSIELKPGPDGAPTPGVAGGERQRGRHRPRRWHWQHRAGAGGPDEALPLFGVDVAECHGGRQCLSGLRGEHGGRRAFGRDQRQPLLPRGGAQPADRRAVVPVHRPCAAGGLCRRAAASERGVRRGDRPASFRRRRHALARGITKPSSAPSSTTPALGTHAAHDAAAHRCAGRARAERGAASVGPDVPHCRAAASTARATAPSGVGELDGDLWFDTDDGHRAYVRVAGSCGHRLDTGAGAQRGNQRHGGGRVDGDGQHRLAGRLGARGHAVGADAGHRGR